MEVCRSFGETTSKGSSKLGSCQSPLLGSILKVPRRNGVLRTDFRANWWPLSLMIFPKQKYFCWADVPPPQCSCNPVYSPLISRSHCDGVGTTRSLPQPKSWTDYLLERDHVGIQHICLAMAKFIGQVLSSTQCKPAHVCIGSKAMVIALLEHPFSSAQIHAEEHPYLQFYAFCWVIVGFLAIFMLSTEF